MRLRVLVLLSVVLVLSACSSGGSSGGSPTPSPTMTASPTPTVSPTANPTASPTAVDTTCRTSQLNVRLSMGDHAAGTAYYLLVFTRRTGAACTLRGYPGVSFVAPNTGKQVGAAAARAAQHPVTTISLASGASASSTLGIADYLNYGTAACKSTAVSGLRVYPPGSTAAVYLPFTAVSAACSTQVNQLTVTAVVPGAAG